MNPGIGPLGEAFGAYAVASTFVIPFALGAGLDERSTSAISIVAGAATVGIVLAWRYLPTAYRTAINHH